MTMQPYAASQSATVMQRFLDYAEANNIYPSADRLRYYADWIFRGVSLRGRTILDVGCGRGLIPIYARCAGASRAVGLEPEADGASDGMLATFRQMVHALGLDNVAVVDQTFDAYVAETGETFDVISLCQVVNHLDEPACMQLHSDQAAQDRYRAIFRKLYEHVKPGGTLIITDCGRRNALKPLGQLGLRHPFAASIEWEKHQEPHRWARLLADVGFDGFHVDWRTPNRLRRLEWALSNGLAARFLTSEFRLTCHR